MLSFEKINKKAPAEAGLLEALRRGGGVGIASLIIMGLSNILAGQIIKGLLFFILEIAFFIYLFAPEGGLYRILKLPSLGEREQGEVWNEALGIYEYTEGDRSQLILLYGIFAVFIC